MISVIQRVSRGEVKVDGRTIGKIGRGYVILLGVDASDQERDADWLAKKVCDVRLFEDADGKMNRSLLEVEGEALVISQFTLLADYRKGRRPSFIHAAPPDQAIPLYEYFMDRLWSLGVQVAHGEFAAMMSVDIQNEGPVTLVMDSQVKFPRQPR